MPITISLGLAPVTLSHSQATSLAKRLSLVRTRTGAAFSSADVGTLNNPTIYKRYKDTVQPMKTMTVSHQVNRSQIEAILLREENLEKTTASLLWLLRMEGIAFRRTIAHVY